MLVIHIPVNETAIDYKSRKDRYQHNDSGKSFLYGTLIFIANHLNAFYFFSDGLPDQIGGEAGRKYQIRRIREAVVKLHEKSISDIGKFFEEDFLDVEKYDEVGMPINPENFNLNKLFNKS